MLHFVHESVQPFEMEEIATRRGRKWARVRWFNWQSSARKPPALAVPLSVN
jgi:hypothetical protein